MQNAVKRLVTFVLWNHKQAINYAARSTVRVRTARSVRPDHDSARVFVNAARNQLRTACTRRLSAHPLNRAAATERGHVILCLMQWASANIANKGSSSQPMLVVAGNTFANG